MKLSEAQGPSGIPGILQNESGPVFAEPWQAQAFAMAVKLHERGLFTWTEWAQMLGARIKAAGDDDVPENYYLHWLDCLETMIDTKGLITRSDQLERKQAWDRAARATPHGQPIELDNE